MFNTRKNILQFFAGLMLLCFATSFLPSLVILSHDHHDHDGQAVAHYHDVEHCTVEDRCHISIYHKDIKTEDCGHEQHLTSDREACDLCNNLFHQRDVDQYTESFESSKTDGFVQTLFSLVDAAPFSQKRSSQSRAPPFIG